MTNAVTALAAPGVNPEQTHQARLWAARQALPWVVEAFSTDEGKAWLCVTLLEEGTQDDGEEPVSFFLERGTQGVVALNHAGDVLAGPGRADLVLDLAAGLVAAQAAHRPANDL